MICCGFGHRDLYAHISETLDEAIAEAIRSGVTTFYAGGMGDFDSQFSSAVRKAKRSNEEIKLVLVKPYFSNELNTNKEYYEYYYDGVLIPDEIAGVHYKAAIKARNRWMIDQSDIVISGVYRDFGGAFDAIRYAAKKDKRIIEVIKK